MYVRNTCLSMLIFILLFLTSCTIKITTEKEKSVSSEEIIENITEAYDTIETVETEVNKSFNDDAITELGIIDFVNDKSRLRLIEDRSIIYGDKGDFRLENDNGKVFEVDVDDQLIFRHDYLPYYQKPLTFLNVVSDELIDEFTMKDEEDSYTFTYSKEAAQDETKVKELYFWLIVGETNPDSYHIDLQSFDLTFTVDKETYYVQEMMFLFHFTTDNTDETVTFEFEVAYKNHNEQVKINIPEITDDPLTEENIATLEAEAQDYLDAFIQATVYQNEALFIERAPNSMDEVDKEEEALHWKEAFHEMYTQFIMDSFHFPVEYKGEVEEVTNAFMNALQVTEYEMVESTYIGDDLFAVTLLVNGIDEDAIFDLITDTVFNEYVADNLTDEQYYDETIKELTNYFNQIDEPLEQVENTTIIEWLGDGEYLVILDDEYFLFAFAQ